MTSGPAGRPAPRSVILRALAALPVSRRRALDLLCRAEDWERLRQALHDNRQLVDDEAADALLLAASAPGAAASGDQDWDAGPDAEPGVWALHCLAGLLRRCVAVGIDRAVDEWEAPTGRGASRQLPDELALAYAEGVLELLSRERSPELWSRTMHNLGTAWQQRKRGHRSGNLEVAIACFRQALQIRTRAQMPMKWALTTHNLGLAYARRLVGDRSQNIERAIDCYRSVLEVFTREASPVDWAMAMSNLGATYVDRLRGDRADNLEQAVSCSRHALAVFTRAAAPADWAMTVVNLGIAYRQRIRGDPAGNLERAVACHRRALKVFTREEFPDHWAVTVDQLGTALTDRIQGERAQNIDRAICCHQHALGLRTPDATPLEWAASQHNLGVAYRERIHGARSENLERSIEHLRLALTIHTRDRLPVKWAATTHELALTYQHRGFGTRADDLDHAIDLLERALEMRTRDAAPFDWASSRYSLGYVYRDRLGGDRVENLERAIACFEDALQVWTREAWPKRWAMTMNNLGAAYRERLVGDPGDNVERSIACLEQALQVRTRKRRPLEWAATQHNLGAAYSERTLGSYAENLEQAIDHYTKALQVRTRERLPLEWAATQHNLAVAFWSRERGDRGDNVDRAIACYRNALEVFARDRMPMLWALSCDGLGVAYGDRQTGQRAADIEEAIAWLEQANTVWEQHALPLERARTMNHLGTLHLYRQRGDREANLERAIACYREALQVHARDRTPELWASTQHNLGNAYTERVRGDHADNLEQAIVCYRQALEVYKLDSMPTLCRKTAQFLASAQAELGRWGDAGHAYRLAVDAADLMYATSLLQETRQQELAGQLHAQAAMAMARAGWLEEAVSTLERGRARGLGEALGRPRDRALLERARRLDPEAYAAFQAASDHIRALEASERGGELAAGTLTAPPAGVAEQPSETLWDARAADERQRVHWLALREQARTARESLRIAAQRIRSLEGLGEFLAKTSLADIADAVQPHAPMAYLATTTLGSVVLLVRSSPPGVERSTDAPSVIVEAQHVGEFTEADLRHLLTGDDPADPDGLLVGQLSPKPDSQAVLRRALETTLVRLGAITGPLADRLIELDVENLVLVPCGLFGLVPLHAARYATRRTAKPRCLLDEFNVAYAPSARVLATARTRAARCDNRGRRNFIGVGDPAPTSYRQLPFAHLELAVAADTATAASFDDVHPLYTTNATRAALLEAVADATHVHLACHGVFDARQPLRSYLALGGQSQLTLEDLLTEEHFATVRLVIASACQTALTNFGELVEEVVGLPAGFLQAGSAGVVGTLWPVEDIAAFLVIHRFLATHLLGDPATGRQPLPPAAALRVAQRWLREATAGELARLFDQLLVRLLDPGTPPPANGLVEIATEGSIGFGWLDPGERPYASEPASWAAFVFVGA